MSDSWDYPEAANRKSSTVNEETSRTRQEKIQIEKGKRNSSKDRVEERIEATLANEEPAVNARSRKASHYLGLFKENTTSQDSKKGRDKGKEKRSKSHTRHGSTDHLREEEPLETIGHERKDSRDGDEFAKQLKVIDSEPTTPQITSPQLLRHHGSSKSRKVSDVSNQSYPGDGFVGKDLPTAEGHIEQHSDGSTEYELPVRHYDENKRRSFTLGLDDEEKTPRSRRSSTQSMDTKIPIKQATKELIQKADRRGEDDEFKAIDSVDTEGDEYESEKEQISSAMYYPHQAPSPDPLEAPLDHNDLFDDSLEPLEKHPTLLDTIHEGVQLPPEEVTLALQSEDESQYLHGDLPQESDPVAVEDASRPSDSTLSSASDTEYESWDDTTRSGREESGVTDDGETTPTTAPNLFGEMLHTRKRRATPLGAVELKPYKHQVGGHTTVFRFSKRAVCKQLSNRENEFYEVVERKHRELLKFLPRYVYLIVRPFD